MGIKFDPKTHTYRDAFGVLLPSVTQVLEPLADLAGIPEPVLENARHRGQVVHVACELLVANDLNWSALAPELVPRVKAFEKFLTDTGFEPEATEERVCHPTLRYAGTLDLRGTLKHRRYQGPALIDIKTSAALPISVGPQTAAYAEALAQGGIRAGRRFALRLLETGQYRLEPLTDPMDMAVFRSCLNIHKWMEKHQ